MPGHDESALRTRDGDEYSGIISAFGGVADMGGLATGSTRPCVASRMLTNGGGWSCASVSGPFMERLCSWPSWISARTRSHSAKGPERPVGSPDHGYDGETVSPFPLFNSQTSAGIFLAC